MRKVLLAGVALVGVAASLPTKAHAQAAPAPVQVYIGGRLFESVFFSSTSGRNEDGVKRNSFGQQSYFRLYPKVNYTAPNGVSYGFSAELRSPGSGSGNRGVFLQRAFGYIQSPVFGNIQVGSPVTALSAVQTGVIFPGTGGWDGEYGFPAANGNGGYSWLLSDNRDNVESITYQSPTFAGVGVTLTYAPNDSTLGNNSANVQGYEQGVAAPLAGGYRNRFEGAVTFGQQFGNIGVKGDVGILTGAVIRQNGGTNYQTPFIFDAGIAVSVFGVNIGGHIDTGKFGGGFAAIPSGVKATTAYSVGADYTIPGLPLTAGVQYYGYDLGQTAALGGGTERFDGGAIGATYKLVPGVTLFFDGLYGERSTGDGATQVGGTGRTKIHLAGLGIGTYFQW